MSDSENEIVIHGILKRVTFRNPSNGYSVLRVSLNNDSDLLTITGHCQEMHAGAHIIAQGQFANHPKFGRQLRASLIEEELPSTPKSIAKYLSSGLIKGIGTKTAEALVDALGENALDVINQDPLALAKIPGVGRHKANLIHAAFSERSEEREIVRFLVERNISPGLAQRIFEKYKGTTIQVLKKDPYLLARQMKGVGFATADSIAMSLGLKPDAPQRLKAGLYYALEKATEDGHCFLPQDLLYQNSVMLLGLESAEDLETELQELIDDKYVVKEAENVSLRYLAQAEDFVARFIAQRASQPKENLFTDEKIKRALRHTETELNIEFSIEQRQAVEASTRQKLLVITGGPGCGKTTIIRAISFLFEHAGKKVLLAAPTGRAAQRMSQSCDVPAQTIHRLLQYNPSTGGFVHGINDPLFGDIVIIDEASMIDILLAKDLFSAIPSNSTLLLVGDKDQLPSVGPGRVFGDILSVPEVQTIELSHLFRRSEQSTINAIAHMVNAGIVPDIPEPDGETKVDAYFLPRNHPNDAAKTIEKLVSDQLLKKFNLKFNDITVLTPSNRGPLGTIALNQQLQEAINPRNPENPDLELKLEHATFRVGDKVCQRVNNYIIDNFGVFNGDVGVVESVNVREHSLVVELWDGRLIKYDRSDLSQLSLAYAISVHRAQGSEMPCVVLALDRSHHKLLERQLIYTGITRAKQLLVIVGQKQAFALACKRAIARKRFTQLRSKIQTI